MNYCSSNMKSFFQKIFFRDFYIKKVKLKKLFLFVVLPSYFFYMISHYKVLRKLNRDYLLNPFYDDINSKEIKSDAINLVEYLFQNSEVIGAIRSTVKSVFISKVFEDLITPFSKSWILGVIKEKSFLSTVQTKLIEIAKSQEVTDQTRKFLATFSQDSRTQTLVSGFSKQLFIRDDVLERLSALCEKSSQLALQASKTKNYANKFSREILSDEEMMSFIYSKAKDVFSLYSADTKNIEI